MTSLITVIPMKRQIEWEKRKGDMARKKDGQPAQVGKMKEKKRSP